jgi:hypothetical protein
MLESLVHGQTTAGVGPLVALFPDVAAVDAAGGVGTVPSAPAPLATVVRLNVVPGDARTNAATLDALGSVASGALSVRPSTREAVASTKSTYCGAVAFAIHVGATVVGALVCDQLAQSNPPCSATPAGAFLITKFSGYDPAHTYTFGCFADPDAAVIPAPIVLNGASFVPAFVSAPVGETKKPSVSSTAHPPADAGLLESQPPPDTLGTPESTQLPPSHVLLSLLHSISALPASTEETRTK